MTSTAPEAAWTAVPQLPPPTNPGVTVIMTLTDILVSTSGAELAHVTRRQDGTYNATSTAETGVVRLVATSVTRDEAMWAAEAQAEHR